MKLSIIALTFFSGLALGQVAADCPTGQGYCCNLQSDGQRLLGTASGCVERDSGKDCKGATGYYCCALVADEAGTECFRKYAPEPTKTTSSAKPTKTPFKQSDCPRGKNGFCCFNDATNCISSVSSANCQARKSYFCCNGVNGRRVGQGCIKET